jgi:hypothetical protein
MKQNNVYSIDKDVIVKELTKRKVSQRRADMACAFHPGMFWKIINERGQNYTVDTLYKISLYLKIPMEKLITIVKIKPNPIRKNYNKK